MMKRVSLVVIVTMLFVLSCSDETTVYSDLQTDVDLETDATKLLSGVVFDNAGVLEITEEATISGKTSKNDELAGDYPLTLIARVEPPSRDSARNLTASHVDIEGDNAYVSYNTVEDGYSGALDIINISDPNNPRITGRVFYTNADINSLAYDSGYLYAVGGFDSEKSATIDMNSFLAKIPISGGSFDLSNISYAFQDGFNATDVKTTNSSVVVASGKDGYLVSFKKSDLSQEYEASYEDLRSLAIHNSEIAVLNAVSGVQILDLELNPLKDISINSDFGDFSKKTIDFTGDKIVVSEGSLGAGVYDVNSGNLLERIPILLKPEGVEPENIVTNAVAINENILLMANGGAGLCLSEDQGANATDLVGIIEIDGSTNFVTSKGDYIFAAAGKAGLQIIKLNRPTASLEALCANIPAYNGRRNLTVDADEDLSYSGSKRFNNVTVNGELLLCGSWTVSNVTNINTNATFSMYGTYVIGRNNSRRDITVGEGATFRVEGNLTVYGDIILKDGASIEFLGTDSVVSVFGSVDKAATATVSGTFDDVQNKF